MDDDPRFPRIRWRNLDDILAALCIAALIGLMFVSIIFRYLVRSPFMWAEEVIGLLFLWAIMLGAVSAQKVNGHLSVDLLVKKFPPTLRSVTTIVIKLVFAGVLVLMIGYGWDLSLEARDKITNMLSISYTYIDLAVPVGAAGMLVYLLIGLYRDIAGFLAGTPLPDSAREEVVAEDS
ncbi:MAG: TRAP transporter small permease [Planctomycetes bacterium]|nr:TRAP transporter small permease [Planctomycetota bacterium]